MKNIFLYKLGNTDLGEPEAPCAVQFGGIPAYRTRVQDAVRQLPVTQQRVHEQGEERHVRQH